VIVNIKILPSDYNVIHDYGKVVQSQVYSECECKIYSCVLINNYWMRCLWYDWPWPWLFCISQKPNLIIVLLYIERNKTSQVFTSSLMASKTKQANLTW